MLFPGLRKRRHNHVYYFRTLQGVLGMLRNSESTESVFDIEEGLRDTAASRLAGEYLLSIDSIRELADERYLCPVPNLDALFPLPQGTLGYHYAHHLRSNGFDPDYYRKIEVHNDLEYLAMRMRQTHDIWHVVIGVGPDPIGELTVKACELAQTRRPMAAVLTAGGVLRYLIKEPELLPDVLQGIATGYSIGSNASPLLAERWEQQWDRPLADIRAACRVEAGAYCPDASTAAVPATREESIRDDILKSVEPRMANAPKRTSDAASDSANN